MISKNLYKRVAARVGVGTLFALVFVCGTAQAQTARDPGVRGGAAGAGGSLPGLSPQENVFFDAGLEDFEEAEGVGDGLGPRFNLDGCGGCHMQPVVGGTSPAVNPQIAVATAFGARNTVPSFLSLNGPVREARFKTNADGSRDGGVHALFVISGRNDGTGNAGSCNIAQDNFAAQVANNNVIFRIPTPVFGLGLIEQISDSSLAANVASNPGVKAALLISGRLNHNGNDGRVSRFGWKAQNMSTLLFSGEAYNVEMGISNELFNVERDETANCQFSPTPNDVTAVDAPTGVETVSAIEKFAFFMRFAAAPTPSTTSPGGSASIGRGKALFDSVGCDNCHTPKLRTTKSTVEALSEKDVNLFSDLALHNMGPGLADGIFQGEAVGDEFRTAPLWGLGQRIFFLHDGRTTDLLQAIAAHRSNASGQTGASEANRTIDRFNVLSQGSKQDVLNFLRSL